MNINNLTDDSTKKTTHNTVIICEKPSVARTFAEYLKISNKKDGYIEGYSSVLNKDIIVTWTIGHLCSMLYPEAYDEKMKKWSVDTLPFLPSEYLYGVIPDVKKQFNIVKSLYLQKETGAIYYAGDSGREGLYIQMLVRQMTGVDKRGIDERVVWIDSQTESEIIRGIKEAKPMCEYESQKQAAYLRAIMDYAVGMNFSRILSLRYGYDFNKMVKSDKYKPIAVGRVMTCVLGMVVRREREIRNFKETVFYRIAADTGFESIHDICEGSSLWDNPIIYNNEGFLDKTTAEKFAAGFEKVQPLTVENVTIKEEKKYAPTLYNLAELQFDCSKKYKISPDDTLKIVQSLYEKKAVTYPRTDARVLSTAVAKEIDRNLKGLQRNGYRKNVLEYILSNNVYKGLEKTRYVDDSKITDHYAIIPTGEAPGGNLSELEQKIYSDIADRFLSIFLPPCVSEKAEVVLRHPSKEKFVSQGKRVKSKGYMVLYGDVEDTNPALFDVKAGQSFNATYSLKEGKTTPPKRYSSGSMVIAMENAGKMIEDEELRAQIKGSGIGTSATRAEIIKKLVDSKSLALNSKTQILTPTNIGEAIFDIVEKSIPELLNPEMTAKWETGLSKIEQGDLQCDVFHAGFNQYVTDCVNRLKEGVVEHDRYEPEDKIICPKCGKGYIKENSKAFYCSEYKNGCDYSVWNTIAGKQLSLKDFGELLGGKKKKMKGFKKKNGTKFDATVYYNEGKIDFHRE